MAAEQFGTCDKSAEHCDTPHRREPWCVNWQPLEAQPAKTPEEGFAGLPYDQQGFAGKREAGVEDKPATTPFSKGYKHREGGPVSDDCGDGRHSECTQDYTKCNCTFRGGHKTPHKYMNAPVAQPAPDLAKEQECMQPIGLTTCGYAPTHKIHTQRNLVGYHAFIGREVIREVGLVEDKPATTVSGTSQHTMCSADIGKSVLGPVAQPAPESAEICDNCHQAYSCWFAPNEVWNAVIPERSGMLCPNCFLNRADRAGYTKDAWSLQPEFHAQSRLTAQGDTQEKLTHTRSCAALTPGNDESCTCGLIWRIRLQTEQTMHAAWRKRATEAEQSLASAREEVAAMADALKVFIPKGWMFARGKIVAVENQG